MTQHTQEDYFNEIADGPERKFDISGTVVVTVEMEIEGYWTARSEEEAQEKACEAILKGKKDRKFPYEEGKHEISLEPDIVELYSIDEVQDIEASE